MSQYRKKPVVIEAERYVPMKQTGDAPDHFPMSDEFEQAVCHRDDNPGNIILQAHIHTLEGAHNVSFGDFIIRGVKGEFYPCKPDIFDLTYESVAVAGEARP